MGYKIAVVNNRSLIADTTRIIDHGDGYVLVGADADTDAIATSVNPYVLSQYAFSRGAFEVRWDCDLRQVDQRFGARREGPGR